MKEYDHQKIEKKWQKEWRKNNLYKTPDKKKSSENFYILSEFPYPSGNLHVGHWYAFAIPDIYARYKRMQGKNVMFPFGFDAFGLPAENAAIKRGLNPKKWTFDNIKYMEGQLQSMGASFDWSRKVVTADPEYYRWTQWMFNQFFKKDLAYQKKTPANWCPSCKTVLANEQVANGHCERCDSEIEKKEILQWNLKITDYAERLLKELDNLPWPEPIKDSQRNWIGRSDGAEIDFPIQRKDIKRFVILHGKEGSSRANFIPWLKEKLEKLGYEVEAPDMPNTSAPDDKEQTDFVEKNCHLDENTFVIGHSFGGIVALRLLERGIKLHSVMLVATPFTDNFKDEIKRPTVSKALEVGFDFEKIKSNAKNFSVLFDTHDEVVPMSDGEQFAKNLDCKLITTKAKDTHFCDMEEPVIFDNCGILIKVFTTRPDTIFGATYLVLSPEHPLFADQNSQFSITNFQEIQKYIEQSKKKTEIERTAEGKEKTGVELKGIKAINPATKEEIPVFVADYVLSGYGTGAIMAVPADDKRDQEFAEKFNLRIVKDYIPAGLEDFGKKITKYKLRDWGVSRQRYWGVPIPIIHCEKCGLVPVPNKDLPVKLPEIKDYLPRDDGKSPLAKAEKWIKVKCPNCKGKAERETDTLDTFVDSSWYFLRYTDPKNKKEFASKAKMENWMPVDFYSGGAEHTTMHLLYSRFWQKALYDLGFVKDEEPYKMRMNRGLILGPDGNKMSKSKGNVIDPDEVVNNLGADTVRTYLAFIGPYNEIGSYPWSTDGIVGTRRFLERVWKLQEKVVDGDEIQDETLFNQTVKKVGEDIESLKMNTAVSQLMIFVNGLTKQEKVSSKEFETLLILLSPIAPHISEELWNSLGHKKSIHLEDWPKYNLEKIVTSIKLAIQINGKMRDILEIEENWTENQIKEKVLALPSVKKRLENMKIKKAIYVKNRVFNIIIE